MKILVTGSNGQLGSEIRKLSGHYPNYRFTFIDVADLDLTDFKASREFLKTLQPTIIINCAAYTAVDKAEQETGPAMEINSVFPGFLSEYCEHNKTTLIHISTDYVFDGLNYKPYTEQDTPNPQGVYALSKYRGEEEILKHAATGLIIRTSWLYSEFGNNFLKTIYNKANTSSQLRVVCDQVGTPTYAYDLAKTILDIIPDTVIMKTMEMYHFSNEGVTSWYDFAKAIVDLANVSICQVMPIETKEYPTPAKRPFYSVLNKSKIKSHFSITIPHWRDSVEKCMERVMKEK